MAVPFNRAPKLGTEAAMVADAARRRTLSGDGHYGKLCQERFETLLGARRSYLTPSCTASLEMSALVAGIGPGDEVIMPSFTFVSTANAFVLLGARIVFVDIRPDTMNIDEALIEAAITPRTKAIVVVHYAGVGCEMDVICDIAHRRGLTLIEDAAHAIGCTYKGRPLGSFGAIGTFSFHETKNLTSGGEGGLIALNDAALLDRAAIARDKGTNRAAFMEGRVDKYSWVGRGSSYLLNEISAAWLWAQLEALDEISARRAALFEGYRAALQPLADTGRIELQTIPAHCSVSGHIFYLKTQSPDQRLGLLKHLERRQIHATFHYVPLHSSKAGQRFGRLAGEDRHTSRDAARLARLPIFYNMTDVQQAAVIEAVLAFFEGPGMGSP
ncbi:MAG: dTDP-4-amino-4,6-dideoxygalactose transaminase [Alphaproteobacteria bacterium]|nr:dTDP-4-amino-4,6-dideoxygalactose transaminase [Alphaproteobacteria bacterium]